VFLGRVQKIRGYYRGLVPEVERFFDPFEQDRETAAEMATVGLRPGIGGLLFTGATTIAAVNSVLGAAGLGLLVAYVLGSGEAVVAVVGMGAAVVLFTLHLVNEQVRNREVAQP
jgi:hypothetical protein